MGVLIRETTFRPREACADCPSHPNLVWDTNLVPPWTEPSNCRHERSQPQPRVCVDSYEVILPSDAAGLILRTPIARMDWLSNAFGFDIFCLGLLRAAGSPTLPIRGPMGRQAHCYDRVGMMQSSGHQIGTIFNFVPVGNLAIFGLSLRNNWLYGLAPSTVGHE